jgi:hypothetical protein
LLDEAPAASAVAGVDHREVVVDYLPYARSVRVHASARWGRKEIAIMMIEIFDKVIAEALEAPNGSFELRPPTHVVAKYTWRARVPGKGVYLGRVDGDDTKDGWDCLVFDHPDTFIPEN